SLIATATWPAGPVEVTGMRTLKSPLLTAVSTRNIARLSVLSATGAFVAIMCTSSPFLLSMWSALLSGGHPELDLGAGARFAYDAAPTAGELGALFHGEQAQMAWQIQALVDHEAGAVVADFDHDPTVERRRRHSDARGMRMLLHVVEGLGPVLEHHGLDVVRKLVREPQVDVGFDSRMYSQCFEAVRDCLFEA